MRGLLVALEGIDGTGKSTQARRLVEALEAKGRTTRLLREPTDGPHGSELRRMAREGRTDPQRERALFIADRREDVEQNIRPALERGEIVVMDRYYFSTVAYQGARGLDPAELRAENEAFAPKPDLLAILDLPVDEALRRVNASRDGKVDHFEEAESLRRVKAIFDAIGDPFALRLDARQSEAAIAEVLLARIEELLGEG